MAVVAPTHPFARRSSIEPEDFSEEHLIIYTADRRDSYTFRHILGPAGVEPARVSQVPLTEAILELAKAGLHPARGVASDRVPRHALSRASLALAALSVALSALEHTS